MAAAPGPIPHAAPHFPPPGAPGSPTRAPLPAPRRSTGALRAADLRRRGRRRDPSAHRRRSADRRNPHNRGRNTLNVVDGGAKWVKVGRSGGRVQGSGGARCSSWAPTPPSSTRRAGSSFPAKFRDQLAEGLVVTRGQERCLTVWPMADFVDLTRRAQEAPVTVKGARDYTRFLFAGASEEKPDKQGRITITPMLREYASLDRDVVVIGVDEPDRDLGPGALAAVLRGAGAEVLRAQRRGLPRGLTPSGTTETDSSTRQQHNGFAGRGLGPAPTHRHLGQLPRLQTTTSQQGAGRDLVRRIHPAAAAASSRHHTRSTDSLGSRHEHHTRCARRTPGAPPGPRGRGADGLLRGHLGGARDGPPAPHERRSVGTGR